MHMLSTQHHTRRPVEFANSESATGAWLQVQVLQVPGSNTVSTHAHRPGTWLPSALWHGAAAFNKDPDALKC